MASGSVWTPSRISRCWTTCIPRETPRGSSGSGLQASSSHRAPGPGMSASRRASPAESDLDSGIPLEAVMNPLVSILIPAFNAQEWIADTLKSAIGQTWPRKEIIVVDDGSRDQTLAIARGLGSKEVSVVTQANQGAAATRNRAYSICQGDYIQWLDADDLLAPDKIARQMEAADRDAGRRMLLSSAWGYFMYRVHRADFVPTPLWCDLSPVEWLLRKLGQNLHMQTATWLVSRELTEAAGPWNTQLLGDDDGDYFYPERLDLVEQAEQLAARLGGRLEIPPPLPWKYAWIQKGFGWPLAKRAQILLPGCKRSVTRSWDKTLSHFDQRGQTRGFE